MHEKKSHARYYQNLLHRYLVFKPKLTVLSTRDSDFLYLIRLLREVHLCTEVSLAIVPVLEHETPARALLGLVAWALQQLGMSPALMKEVRVSGR